AAIPGVTSAAIASFVPMDGRTSSGSLFAEDKTYASGETPPTRRFKFVSPGYFRAMGTRLIAGRDMTWSDIDAHGQIVVISENLARELWGEPSAAIGKRVRESRRADAPSLWREVIGVVQDVHEDGPHQKSPAMVYWPILMENF